MYAIVKVGGKQYRVEKGDSLVVDRMRAEEGAKVSLEPLLYRSDKTVFDGSELGKVKVEAVVTGHERGKKIRVFKFKPKVGYKRTQGHRSELTRLEIKDIKLLTRKPAAEKPAAEKPAAKARKPAAKAQKPAAEASAGKTEAAGKAEPTKKPARAKAGAAKGGAKPASARRKPAAKKKETDDGS
jgi:large subunit ribosomal protein L21